MNAAWIGKNFLESFFCVPSDSIFRFMTYDLYRSRRKPALTWRRRSWADLVTWPGDPEQSWTFRVDPIWSNMQIASHCMHMCVFSSVGLNLESRGTKKHHKDHTGLFFGRPSQDWSMAATGHRIRCATMCQLSGGWRSHADCWGPRFGGSRKTPDMP